MRTYFTYMITDINQTIGISKNEFGNYFLNTFDPKSFHKFKEDEYHDALKIFEGFNDIEELHLIRFKTTVEIQIMT